MSWPAIPLGEWHDFTTSLMPHRTGPAFQIDLDLIEYRLDVATVDGATGSLALQPRSVAEFYSLVMGTATDPDAVPPESLQTTYEAAATTAGWDRAALERPTEGSRHG